MVPECPRYADAVEDLCVQPVRSALGQCDDHDTLRPAELSFRRWILQSRILHLPCCLVDRRFLHCPDRAWEKGLWDTLVHRWSNAAG